MKGFRLLFLGGFLGKLLGILREIVFASAFGTGSEAAAFRLASAATFIPMNVVASETLTLGFLPSYVKRRASSERAAASLFRGASGFTVIAATSIATFTVVCRERVISVLAPGLDAGIRHLAVSMLLVLALGVWPYIATSFASCLEMAHGGYWIATVRPAVQSIGLMAGTASAIVTGFPTLLAWGFTAAYFLLYLCTIFVVRPYLRTMPRHRNLRAQLSETRNFVSAIRPLLVLPLIVQSGYAVERIVASTVSQDAVAAVDYSRLVTDTALVIFAAPLGLSLLSNLSIADPMTLRLNVTSLMGASLMLFLPLSLMLWLFSAEVTRVIFERGAFDQESTAVTAEILKWSGAGLWLQVCGYLLLKVLSAQGRNRLVLVITVLSVSVAVASNILLAPVLGEAALGIAVSCLASVQVVFALVTLQLVLDFAKRMLAYVPFVSVLAAWVAIVPADAKYAVLQFLLLGTALMLVSIRYSDSVRSDALSVWGLIGSSGRPDS